jgi:hypothetical protein
MVSTTCCGQPFPDFQGVTCIPRLLRDAKFVQEVEKLGVTAAAADCQGRFSMFGAATR